MLGGKNLLLKSKPVWDWAVSTFCSNVDHLDMEVCVFCFWKHPQVVIGGTAEAAVAVALATL